tara:strand:- start:1075 stop:1926 length:852 start_codon:yes stop_codon:yes gene_type:complete
MGYTNYEKGVQQEIEHWKNEKEGGLSKFLTTISKPFVWLYDNVIPNSVDKTISKAVLGFLEMLRDFSFWTYSNSDFIKEAKKIDIQIVDYRDLKNEDLETCDRIARRYFNSNKIIALLEGLGCGLGGFALIVADIPALFTISFRAVQQIGSSYGFDMEDPDMFPVVMSVFNAGSAASSTAKAAALADMRIAAKAYAKNWTYKKVAQRTQTGIIANLLKQRTKNLPKDIANNVTKRKLSQTIPVFGAAIGAGFNYWFLSSTVRSAYMIFRDMYITRKYQVEEVK